MKKEDLPQTPQEHKSVVVQVPTAPSEAPGPGTRHVTQPQAPPAQGVFTGSTTPQTVTVQLPLQGGSDGQGSQQQLVILMPQQMSGQVQSPLQAQQPIVIVMPQTGGTQMAQPIVVPVPQLSNN